MNEKEAIFNDYCSIIIGHGGDFYNDLNLMEEVFDKLMEDAEFLMFKFLTYDCTTEPPTKVMIPVKQAMRDFIISTMESKDE